jgi:hypothetical protein
MRFKEWFLETNINPDVLYQLSDKKIAFIYNPDNTIFYGNKVYDTVGKEAPLQNKHEVTHIDIIIEHMPYYQSTYDRFKNDAQYTVETIYDMAEVLREKLEDISLLGRTGQTDGKHYVAFWNHLDKLLPNCLKRLQNDHVINQNTWVTTPTIKPTLINDTPQIQQVDPNYALANKIHTMNAIDKKNAMLQLGLSPFSKKNKWQQGSEETDLVKPGQKWWAATSEVSL